MIGKKVRKKIQQLLLMLCILKKEKNNGDFLCINCPYFFRTKKRLESHKKVRENKDFCNVIIYALLSTIYHLCRCWMCNRKDWWL